MFFTIEQARAGYIVHATTTRRVAKREHTQIFRVVRFASWDFHKKKKKEKKLEFLLKNQKRLSLSAEISIDHL